MIGERMEVTSMIGERMEVMSMIGSDPQCLPFWIATILTISDLMTKVNFFDDLNKNTHFLLN